MKKTIVALIVGMFLLNLVGGIDVFAGEPYVFELEESYDYYSIIGNSTEIELNITQEGNNVTIVFSKYTLEDSFSIIFFNKEKEIIHHYSSSGGGGGGGGGGGSYSKTEYVEVDNYIDRVVYKDKEEETKDKEEPQDTKGFIIPYVIVVFVVALILLYSIVSTIRRRRITASIMNQQKEEEDNDT